MKKLFIIGNGFDIDHGLKTKYSDFQDYLINTYGASDRDFYYVPEPKHTSKHDSEYNYCELAQFIYSVISMNMECSGAWYNIEDLLGKLNYEPFLQDEYSYDIDEDYEWGDMRNNEDIATMISSAMVYLYKFFKDWVNQIDVTNVTPKEDFKKLIQHGNNLFMSFNYTETLECVYNLENVFHIHGKQGQKLVFGHGESCYDFSYYERNYPGSESVLLELDKEFEKDTRSIIKNYSSIFKNMVNIDEVYSYGFSFSEVDLVYMRELFKNNDTNNIVWHFNMYDNDKIKEFQKKLKSHGFLGKFGEFRIKN